MLPREHKLVRTFEEVTGRRIPKRPSVQYHFDPQGFIAWEIQWHKSGDRYELRVHAWYLLPGLTRFAAKRITQIFEAVLERTARRYVIKEITFYTKRNLKAFLRRLNQTVPEGKKWGLDSYVITRKV